MSTPAPIIKILAAVDSALEPLVRAAFALPRFALVTAHTAPAALAALKREPFGAVVVATSLPGGSAADLVQSARSTNAEAAICLFADDTRASRGVGVVDGYFARSTAAATIHDKVIAIAARRAKLAADRPFSKVVVSEGPAARQVVCADADATTRDRFGGLLTARGYEVATAESLDNAPDIGLAALVVSAKLCTDDAVRKLWKLQSRNPGMRLLVIVDAGAEDEVITATMVGALTPLFRHLDDEIQTTALVRALGPPPSRS